MREWMNNTKLFPILPAAASLPSHHRVVPSATRPLLLASPSACAAMVVRPPPWVSLFPNLVNPN
ncbi:hypothetical protein SESBI_42434 [Sesbania bispinosa]|nr:hypothetical protein SESBI_42434 [Sesbania bispinosa]